VKRGPFVAMQMLQQSVITPAAEVLQWWITWEQIATVIGD